MRIVLAFILLFQSIPVWSSKGDLPLNYKIKKFKELQDKVAQHCIHNKNSKNFHIKVDGNSLNCSELLLIVDHFKNEIEKEVLELEDCEKPSLSSEAKKLTDQSLVIANKAGMCEIKSQDSQCIGEIGCAALGGAGTLIKLLAKKDSSIYKCADQGSSCIQNVFKGIFDSIWTTLTSLWDLTKKAGTWLGETLHIIKKHEASSSEKLMAAQQAGPGFISRFKKDPIGTIKKMASDIYQGLKMAAMQSYGCEKWSGVPFVSECVTPMTNWDCATCKQKINVFCGIGGFAVGEIVSGLLTGGIAAGAKFIAKGTLLALRAAVEGSKISKAASLSLKAAKLAIEAIPKSAEGLEVASRIAVRTAAGAKRVLNAAELRAIKSWRAISGSRASQTVAKAAQRVAKNKVTKGAAVVIVTSFKPLTAYLRAIDEATVLGFKTVDKSLSKLTSATKVVKVTKVQETKIMIGEADIAHSMTRFKIDDIYAPLYKESLYPEHHKDLTLVLMELEKARPAITKTEIRDAILRKMNSCEL